MLHSHSGPCLWLRSDHQAHPTLRQETSALAAGDVRRRITASEEHEAVPVSQFSSSLGSTRSAMSYLTTINHSIGQLGSVWSNQNRFWCFSESDPNQPQGNEESRQHVLLITVGSQQDTDCHHSSFHWWCGGRH